MDEIIRKTTRVLEHFLGRYYEGPSLPRRFSDEVQLFVAMEFPGDVTEPGSVARTWADFALALARSAWQQAFVRGAEWRERREAGEPPEDHAEEDERSIFDDPAVLATLAAARDEPVAAGVPGAVEALAREGEATGAFRVFVDAPTGPVDPAEFGGEDVPHGSA